MNKKTILSLIILLLLAACSRKAQNQEVEPSKVEVKDEESRTDELSVKANTFASKIIIENMDNQDINVNLDTNSNYSAIENGDFDVAVIPAYLGPYFYNNTNKGMEVAAISSIDNIKIVSDSIINNQSDLKGKNLYITDPTGNISKAVDKKLGPLNIFLKLNTEYFKNMDQILKRVSESSNFLTIMVDPYYERIVDKDYYVSDLSSLLSMGDDEFVSEIIIVNKNYLKNNKASFDKFLRAYKNSSLKVNDKAIISEEILEYYKLSEDQAKEAIKRINPTFIQGAALKGTYDNFLEKLASFDNSLVNDVEINDSFYYMSK